MRRRIGRSDPEPIDRQVDTFHRVFTELVRKYQFRDRQELACHGLTVSQCHALEVLGEDGRVRMGSLASRLHLTESTATRIIDQLVGKDLAVRWLDDEDRRVCCVGLSPNGRRLHRRIRSELHARERAFLERMAEKTRRSLIDALGELSEAVDGWRAGDRKGGRDEKQKG
jgi:DNA-binding MarR family transcriptional regulator